MYYALYLILSGPYIGLERLRIQQSAIKKLGDVQMIISERIFEIMKEKNIKAKEFAKMTGIGQSTISDWKTKKTNPQANKIMIICEALNVSPEDVLFDTMTVKQKKDKIDKDLEAGKITLNQARKLLDFEPVQ